MAGCSGPTSKREPDPRGSDGDYAYVDGAYRAPSGVLLARPSDPEEDNPTLRTFVDLVRHTPTGARIRIVAHSFSFVPAAQALVEAHRRDVAVQVIVDRSVSSDFQAVGLLRDELGTGRGSSSFVYLAPGELHQKTWSFTRTGTSRDVVLVGSTNLTYESARQYTDVVSYADRPDVRRVFDRRFTHLLDDLPDARAEDSVPLGRDRAWFYPGYTEATDPVLDALAAVPASGARVRVVMYAWLDERGLGLARLLAEKDDAGADVDVVLGPSVGPAVRRLLEASGVEVHPGVFADGDEVHHKLTLVSYRDADDAEHRFVLTGSDNYTAASLRRPELLLRLDADRGPRFARYDRWVDALVARGRREARAG